MPQFIIPVINDAFGTRYPMDVEYEQLKNEFYTKNGRIVSDSIFLIKGHLYHVECQSNPDNTMAIRMFEYGMEIALERARKKKDYLHVDLPESADMLRSQKKAREEMRKMGGKVLELYSEKKLKEGEKNLASAIKDVRSGMKPAELKKKYNADTIKLAKAIG